MDVIFTHCAGLDVHKKSITVCRVVPDPTEPAVDGLMEVRTFGTMTIELLALADWLTTAGITHVAMESTGVYVRRITARAISLAEGTGSGGNPWVNDSPRGRKSKGTAACRRSGAAQQPCMVRLCQPRVLW
jgi:hypothetical protein